MSEYNDALIRGTVMPAAGVLERGEEAVVPLTERIHRLSDAGHIEILAVYDDGESAPEGVEQLTEDLVPPAIDAPARNASREDWAEFLAQHPAGFVTEGKDRTTLLAEWDAYNASLEGQGSGGDQE